MSLMRKSMSGLATVMILGALAGCGGSGSTPTGGEAPEIVITGGVVTTEATATDAIPADEDSHLIGDAEIPPGVAVAAGESVAVIPDLTEFISGLTGGARATTTPGAITINGKLMKSRVVNGKITPAIGLPRGRYHLEATGPFVVRGPGGTLTIQTASFDFDCNGHVLSLPRTIAGSIPTNNSNNWKNSLNTTYIAPYNTGTATLDIVHTNGELKQTRTVTAAGGATFSDFANDPQSHIPRQGINTLNFTHFGLTPP